MNEKEFEKLAESIEKGILNCLKENPGIENEIPWFTLKALKEDELELA